MRAADTVLVGGSLFLDGASRPGAVALAGGRIVLVGTDDEVRETVGPHTEVVDVRGGLVLPAFQDAHAHPLAAGVDMLRCDLTDARSAEDTVARIAAYAGERPDLPWVLGSGWSMAHFPGGTPTREALDAVVRDRPALLSNRDGHGAWANSRALELAGLTAATPDPPDGRIERDPTGAPSGTLHEGAVALVERLAPLPTPADQLAGLLAAQQVMFSYGITAWQDAAVGALFGQPDSLPVYLRAHASGELRARVVAAQWWHRDRGAEQVAELVERRDAAAAQGFAAGTVKVMQDGVVENFTAGLLGPYLDGCGTETGNRGLSFVDPVALAEHVTGLDRARLPGALPRAGRPGGARVPGRGGGRAQRERPGRRPAPRGPPAGGRPGRPRAVRRARRGRDDPAAVGGARAADGRPDHPVPRRAAVGPAVPVRRPGRGRRAPRRRQRLAGEQPRPGPGRARRGQPRPPPRARRRGASRCHPATGSTSGRR